MKLGKIFLAAYGSTRTRERDQPDNMVSGLFGDVVSLGKYNINKQTAYHVIMYVLLSGWSLSRVRVTRVLP